MRSIRPLAFSLAAALLVGAAGSLAAEDVDLGTTIDSLKTAVQEKHYGRALTDIQSLLAEVVRLRAETLKPLLPDAPSGWTAEEAEADGNAAITALGAGIVVRRAYTKGESRVTLELSVGGAWFGMLQMALSNPMLAGPTMKQVTLKGRKGMLDTSNSEDKSFTLQVLLSNAASVLKIEGQGVTRDDVEKTFGGAVDFDKVEKVVND